MTDEPKEVCGYNLISEFSELEKQLAGIALANGLLKEEIARREEEIKSWKHSYRLLNEKFEEMTISEHKLSDAYLRISKLVGAWQTLLAPTSEQIFELTESKIKTLLPHMNPYIESRINSPLNKAVCDLSDWIDSHDKQDNIHYGCSWVLRDDKIYHCCNEQKKEWEVK